MTGLKGIVVAIRCAHRFLRFPRQEAQRVIRSVLSQEGARGGLVSVVWVGDREMRRLNGRYLRHPWTTDVLSFLYEHRRNHLEGELVVNLDQARRQAPRFRATYSDEVRRLLVHGALHLTGWNDDTRARRLRMSAREDELLRSKRDLHA